MGTIDDLPVVREGVWLYASVVPVQVRILCSAETWGTGDYEDEARIAENQPITCFFLAYEAAGSPGNFCNIVPNLSSLAEATLHAEQQFPNIKWDSDES